MNIFFILSLFILFWSMLSFNSNANPVPIASPELGGLIPKEDTNLSMTNANVIVEIDATNLNKIIDFSFSGNYTIFNPSEMINVTIAAPFSNMIYSENIIGDISLNDSSIPFSIRPFNFSDSLWLESSLWKEYLQGSGIPYVTFLICNITIPENTSITLEYTFDSNITVDLRALGELFFRYDVGTSRVWKGNVTESVEFRVFGKTPDEFYNNSCTVSDLQDGKIYLWEWKNEIIYDDYVYIMYYGNYSWPSYFIPFGNSFLTIKIIFVFVLVYVIKLRRSK